MLTRRRLITLAAPAIVCAANIMPIKVWPEPRFVTFDYRRHIWTFQPGSLVVTMEEMVDRVYRRPQLQLRS